MRLPTGFTRCTFEGPVTLAEAIGRIGQMPLPPYIKRDAAQPDPADKTRYQTVYARSARRHCRSHRRGLHFTDAILARIREKGVTVVTITLHVGYGTFVPVRVDDIREHRMHEECVFLLPKTPPGSFNQAKFQGRRVVAVGDHQLCGPLNMPPGTTAWSVQAVVIANLFIYPGYTFKLVDAMLTNFHLPRSTLLMLVSAFAAAKQCYRPMPRQCRSEYRFFSYGDAMLIE